MQIQKFWVVTQPTSLETEFADICFLTDWKGIERQFKGGLAADDIIKVFDDEMEARTEAARILKAYRIRHLTIVK